MVYRVYVEKKAGQTHEADGLLREIRDFLQIEGLTSVRVLNRYDAENLEESLFNYAVNTVFFNGLKFFTRYCIRSSCLNSKLFIF